MVDQPILPPALIGTLDVLMIDNFDSFTWNLYQQLSLLGADVTVIRNDAITPVMLPHLKINFLIISPGPGHPKTDSGISGAAVEYFQGKVPIFGVCMGLECIVDLYGGKIGYAGEIMHGKVSAIRHDNRGCFRDIPQGIKSIRYHSLSASYTTLPPDLSITSVTEESGVIMGIRHRKYTLEAVQYHPESILSEAGDDLLRNFLSLRGGTWEENLQFKVLDGSLPPFPVDVLPKTVSSDANALQSITSVVEKICAQRVADVAIAQSKPGATIADLELLLKLNIAPSHISFVSRLKQTSPGHPSLLAEIKRASPSTGPISLSVSAAAQASKYALAGAHAISVLTEPKWFQGSLHDMLHARLIVENVTNRPAILRKDFILSRYQVLESRIWGADSILLIVSTLTESLLKDLYYYSKELGMEPLVEVNNAKEMEIALSLPAKVIGVNNRNLHDFKVDMGTASRLSVMVQGKDIILCALSGISTPQDVQRFTSAGIHAVLVGESIMRAEDPGSFIHSLLSLPEPSLSAFDRMNEQTLVKICGIRTKDEAHAIAQAGADMLGLVFAQGSKRQIDLETAKNISATVREFRFTATPLELLAEVDSGPWFATHSRYFPTSRPLLVGVFQNQPLSFILHVVSHAQLDMVQLHGTEPLEWAHRIPVPVIRAFHIGLEEGITGITRGGYHQYILLDSLRSDGSNLSGGSGKPVDWELAKRIVDAGETTERSTSVNTQGKENSLQKLPLPVILAGGLTSLNIAEAVTQVHPWAVDVSGGVETEDGMSKDLEKVRAFIEAAKSTVKDKE